MFLCIVSQLRPSGEPTHEALNPEFVIAKQKQHSNSHSTRKVKRNRESRFFCTTLCASSLLLLCPCTTRRIAFLYALLGVHGATRCRQIHLFCSSHELECTSPQISATVASLCSNRSRAMDDDDDVDFFLRKPLASKSKPKPKAKALISVASSSSSNAAGTSSGNAHARLSVAASCSSDCAALAPELIEISDDEGSTEVVQIDLIEGEDEDEDEELAVLYSSEVSIDSDDSDADQRRTKRRRSKKKRIHTLPAWASHGVYRQRSQEACSSSASADAADAADVDTRPESINKHVSCTQTASKALQTQTQPDTNTRARRESLTPPPAPSAEKLEMARELVNRTIASKFGTSASSATAGAAATTSWSSTGLSSNSVFASRCRIPTAGPTDATIPAYGQPHLAADPSSGLSAGASRRDCDDEVGVNEQIDWDPDLARLMRGEKAKHIREKARRLQQERDQRRRQLQAERQRSESQSAQSAAETWAQFARTQSAPQQPTMTSATRHDVIDSDDEVEFIARPPNRNAASRRRARSSVPTTIAPSTNIDTIIIDDSDDDPTPSNPTTARTNTSHRTSASPPACNPTETLSLTLQSKLGSMAVTVTPTTLLSRIIEHFHHTKLTNHASVHPHAIKISFDGFAYTPNQTVQDMDVEDGDQIELSWS